jgi:ADP-ribosylglycohydrolase
MKWRKNMFNPEALKGLVLTSIESREQQGYDMAALSKKAATLESADCGAWIKLYDEIAAAPKRPDYHYIEPNGLEEIRALRPEGKRVMDYNITALELADKIHGGLLGRIMGVILGRPIEGWEAGQIRKYLEGAGCYPLDYYFPRQTVMDGKPEKCVYQRLRCTREYLKTVKYAEPDDDINYIFLALKLLENVGVNFSTLDVGFIWLENIEVNWLWGPERTAYLNLARYTESEGRWDYHDDGKVWEIAHYLNGYSELIGALIRGDVYGYISPGLTEFAAELAYRDAAFTHVGNGIYGEMFASAMIAAAFCSDDIIEVINAGLAEIPTNCRLAEAIRNTVEWFGEFGDWQKVYEKININYNVYEEGHTINNAAIIVNALLASKGNFEKAICISVMQGEDTDCTAATVGSVAGIMAGACTLPEKWTAPINDTVHTAVFGESSNSISAVAARIYNISNMITKTQRKIKFRHAEPGL